MGKSASHAIVYAQLYMPDGKCNGLHMFIVQLRDPYSYHTMPGVTIGDMGAKLGLNGFSNGLVYFGLFLHSAKYSLDRFLTLEVNKVLLTVQ